jgi:hypothetical protein
MKLKFDKYIFPAMGIAALASLVTVGFFSLLALISWWLAWAGVFVLLFPVAHSLVKKYKDGDYSFIDKFIKDIIEENDEDDNKPFKGRLE